MNLPDTEGRRAGRYTSVDGSRSCSKRRRYRPIPAYSPQARGRSERNFGTWQGRLPQELRIRQIRTIDEANHFLRSHYIAEFNRKFIVPATQSGSAFVPITHLDLDRIFSNMNVSWPETTPSNSPIASFRFPPHAFARHWLDAASLSMNI